MLVLCVLSMVLLTSEVFLAPDPEVQQILTVADTGICIAFLADFTRNLVRAPRRLRYLTTWGLLDLLSSIPSVDALRWGRAGRVVRVLRLFRGIKASKVLVFLIRHRRSESAVLGMVLLTVIMIIFSAIAVLYVEAASDGANILTASDAIWWVCVTISTVGYGDFFPTTIEGRLIGGVLMTLGVGLFAVFSGFVASWFLAQPGKTTSTEVDTLRKENAELRASLHQYEKNNTAKEEGQ